MPNGKFGLKKLSKSYLGKMTGELSKGYLARVNLQEKGLESAEIILQVNKINPLGNSKYGLIIHDCQNQMKALLNSSMSGHRNGKSEPPLTLGNCPRLRYHVSVDLAPIHNIEV